MSTAAVRGEADSLRAAVETAYQRELAALEVMRAADLAQLEQRRRDVRMRVGQQFFNDRVTAALVPMMQEAVSASREHGRYADETVFSLRRVGYRLLGFGQAAIALGYHEAAGRCLHDAYDADPMVISAEEEFYGPYLERNAAFERGWRQAANPTRPHLGHWPGTWDGRPFSEGRLQVIVPHGLGDRIQSLRWLPHLVPHRPLVLIPQNLVRLTEPLVGAENVVPTHVPGQVPAFTHEPAARITTVNELMVLRRDTVATIPPAPYLTPDRALVAAWRPRIESHGPGLRVGLVWAAGGDEADRGPERTIELAALAPLFRVPGIRWFALQKGRNEHDAAPHNVDLPRLGPDFTDFADTAAAMACLDVVISVDSSPAHLAGAVGAPVWMLLDAEGDPRWPIGGQHGSDRTVWYPSMRIFRQKQMGEWFEPVQRVANELRGLATERGTA